MASAHLGQRNLCNECRLLLTGVLMGVAWEWHGRYGLQDHFCQTPACRQQVRLPRQDQLEISRFTK